jgi:GT2 family glycosyltransferase
MPDLLTRYADVLSRKENVIYQGEVIYLPRDAEAMNGQNDALANEGAVHPLHAGRRQGESIPHALFWSLNFACRRETFERIGGFDTRYCGYGGEDTDFAFRAASARIPIEFVDALALHQFHEVIDPPLNHLATIVGNSRIFREKWGRWPMEGWLSQFEKMGFITISASEINIRRLPSREEIADATK